MLHSFPLFPERASASAGQIDHLYFFLIAISAFFAGLIFLLIAIFAVKYRRREGHRHATQITKNIPLEIAWTGIPLLLTMVMFVWGAKLFFNVYRSPDGAMEIFVVGKQWMWKFQHPEGRLEINELHVPRGQPVKLSMISEDVIHDLFLPAFRIRKDVLPGRYASMWFEATKTGTYHLLCSQYCGTQHSKMRGWVYVMEPTDYARWLSGAISGEPLTVSGERLFQRLGCAACHAEKATARGPSLAGLFGRQVKLQTGASLVADEDYIRESIIKPEAKLTAGYAPIMPTFKGIVNEEGLLQLIAYIKSLPAQPTGQTP